MENIVKHIAIVGLGLIGGSLALDLKVHGYHITAITKNTETIELAKKRGVIDHAYTSIDFASLNNVDVIFLALPLSLITTYIEQIANIVKHEVVLTDVGSTKLEICNFAKKVLPKNITFIGGHPMAGTEKAGFLSAQLSLFKNCAWILTPLDENNKSQNALQTIEKIITKLGAKALISSPEEHDKAVALVSHLPLLASVGLCYTVKNLQDKKLSKLATLIASSGFRDTTRIGGGNPKMNADLITLNSSCLLPLLPEYLKNLEEIINIAKENPELLEKTLSEINEWRSSLYNNEGKNNLIERSRNL